MPIAKSDEQWKIDNAIDTLIEAEKVKRDKKLFPKVKAGFKRRLREMEQAACEVKVAQKQAEIRAKGGD